LATAQNRPCFGAWNRKGRQWQKNAPQKSYQQLVTSREKPSTATPTGIKTAPFCTLYQRITITINRNETFGRKLRKRRAKSKKLDLKNIFWK